MRWPIVLVAACGGATTGPAPAAKPAPLDPVTCHDASVILRGPIASDDEHAGPARESAILLACEGDHWPAPVLGCAARERKPSDCLAQLTDVQRQSYDAKLGTWEAQYGGSEEP